MAKLAARELQPDYEIAIANNETEAAAEANWRLT